MPLWLDKDISHVRLQAPQPLLISPVLLCDYKQQSLRMTRC